MNGGNDCSNVSSDVGTLEFILNALYGKDCRELASALIRRFGSFFGIFKATREELLTIDGITERTAAFFTYAGSAYLRALEREATDIIDSEHALILQAITQFAADGWSGMSCLHIDERNRLVLAETVDEQSFAVRAVGGAARYGSKKIALIRCCRNGEKPMVDVSLLQSVMRVAAALELLDARLVDYIEFRPFKFFSLRRAATGSAEAVDAESASEERYPDIKLSPLIAKYLESRKTKRAKKV